MKTLINHVLLLPLLLSGQSAIDNATTAHLEKIIDMRHQIHQNPELGNREFKIFIFKNVTIKKNVYNL